MHSYLMYPRWLRTDLHITRRNQQLHNNSFVFKETNQQQLSNAHYKTKTFVDCFWTSLLAKQVGVVFGRGD